MKQRLQSFKHAIRGIRMVLKSERNMQIHLIFVLLVTVFGFLFNISPVEWMFCLLAFGLVMGAEMMNTAVEAIVDLVSPDYHPLAGRAKDIAAGAVLITAIAAAITGLIIFVPKAISHISSLWSSFSN
jgi:diacylglycerol kinase